MSVKKAKAHYGGKDGHQKLNCAQSVMVAFKEKHGISDEVINACAAASGGRAPEGQCGALYAAKQILALHHPEKAASCERAFIEAAGSSKCKEIRSLKKLPCIECVAKAAEFLESI